MAMIDKGAEKKERPRDVPRTAPALLDRLSEDEREAIRVRARAAAEAEKRAEAEKAYYQQALEEERRLLEPEQELRDIVIDLAPFSKCILIDGKQYHHGLLYEVRRQVFDQLQEIMARGWAHDEEVGEPNKKQYQKPLNVGTANYGSRRPQASDLQISLNTVDSALAAQKARMGAR